MSERRVGKPAPRDLERLLSGGLGQASPRLRVGPGPGLDAAVLDLGDGRVMAVAEDPIFPAPGLPLEIMGWFTVHIGASDVAVTGIRPEFMTYTLLLPGPSPESDARIIVRAVSAAAEELGICIVGGHTGWYDAVAVPIVGGVTVWGTAGEGDWISPGGARDGDVILMTKGPSIEAAALLGVIYRERLAGQMPAPLLEQACSRTRQISVVADALAAFPAGGVHAMHDATEGGVLGGLWEMQAASGMRVHADLDAVEVPADISALAAALDFDPWQAISEGTLLAAVDPRRAPHVREVWRAAGIDSFVLGRFAAPPGESTVRRAGRVTALVEPREDPFWKLFFAGLAQA